MATEASAYVQEARRLIHIIKDQLIELDQLRSQHDEASKEYKQLTEIMERLDKEQERFGLIVRSYVRNTIKKTIETFREESSVRKPTLKIVK